MEIKDVQVVKPFGPLIMLAQLPEGFIKKLNEVVDVIKDKKDMGARLAGVIETESEIPHSMLEEKKVMDIFHALSRGYIEQAYLNAGQKDLWNIMDVKTQMQSIWSVSQYENEYNPQHNHSHCQISAVLYLKIPAMKPRNLETYLTNQKKKMVRLNLLLIQTMIFLQQVLLWQDQNQACVYYFQILYIIKYIHFKVQVKEEVLHLI